MDNVIVSIPASQITSAHIGAEVYIPRVNVMGVLSDFGGSTLYVGGVSIKVKSDERVVF